MPKTRIVKGALEGLAAELDNATGTAVRQAAPAIRAGLSSEELALSARDMVARAITRLRGESQYVQRAQLVADELKTRGLPPITEADAAAANWWYARRTPDIGSAPPPVSASANPAAAAATAAPPPSAAAPGASAAAPPPPTPGASPKVKKNNTQPSNEPAVDSKVSSKEAAGIPGYQNMMSGGTTLLTAGAGGLIGGAASYATGGEFFQGAAAGSIIGAGGVAAGMGIMNANRSFLAKNAAGVNDIVSSMTTAQRRNAMFGGAGLSGMIFGGDRRSHKRGFNQSRGNTF